MRGVLGFCCATSSTIKITDNNVNYFVYGYYGRKVEVTCTDGFVFTGKVGWFEEDMGEPENEEEYADWVGLGIAFNDVTDSEGNTATGTGVELTQIDFIKFLERANTEEEIKKLFA
jgi:hypothetical protein